MVITYLSYTVSSPAIESVSPSPGTRILPTTDTFEVQFDHEVKLFFTSISHMIPMKFKLFFQQCFSSKYILRKLQWFRSNHLVLLKIYQNSQEKIGAVN